MKQIFLNFPNQLTLSRIGLAGIFMWLIFSKGILMKSLALIVFLIASMTDYWDGQIARKTNQTTAFGEWMDPIADKLLTLSAFMAFVQIGIIPAWMVVVIIARDLLITGFRLLLPSGTNSVAARSSGKHKTALQFLSIIGILSYLILKETSYWNTAWTPHAQYLIIRIMYLVVAITLFSGIRYIAINKHLFGQNTSK